MTEVKVTKDRSLSSSLSDP